MFRGFSLGLVCNIYSTKGVCDSFEKDCKIRQTVKMSTFQLNYCILAKKEWFKKVLIGFFYDNGHNINKNVPMSLK